MLSIDYIRLQRKIVLEVQQTEIEKLADSFKLAGFTLTESFKKFFKSMADSFNFLGFLFTPERSSTSISIFKWNKISSYLHDALTKGGPFQEFWDHGHSGDVDEPTWYHGYLTTLT